jgi:KaiC/GvpD/RAD55 family RecA-like ATPase
MSTAVEVLNARANETIGRDIAPSPAPANGSSAPVAAKRVGVRLETMTAAELAEKELGATEWLLTGLMPVGGMVILYGAPKAGKTTFALAAAVANAGGRPFLGESPNPVPVLWLDLEQPERVTKKRMIEAGADTTSMPFHIWHGSSPRVEDLMATIDELGAKLVVVDSLSRWLMLRDENDNAELNRTLGPILDQFRKRDVTLALIHHDRKSDGDHGKNLRGAGSLLAMCDIAIEVRQDGAGDSPTRRLNIISRHDGRRELRVRLTTEGYVSDGSPVESRERAVLNALTSGKLTLEDLAVVLDLSPKQTRSHLAFLAGSGRIKRTGAGKKGDPHYYEISRRPSDSGKSESPGC